MKYSNALATKTILKFIGNEELKHIDEYVKEFLQRDFKVFSNINEIDEALLEGLERFYNSVSYDELLAIKLYTSKMYKEINAVLRDNWTYDTNGLLSEEKQKEYLQLGKNIEMALRKAPVLPCDIKVFRGVNVTAFQSFGITSISELAKLKGSYLYEQGFTSTSLLKSSSYFNKDVEYDCHIEIEYLIPHECSDGLPLLINDLSYSPEQNEFLINCHSLVKVLDVSISDDKKKAYLKVAYIPSNIWNRQMKDTLNDSR